MAPANVVGFGAMAIGLLGVLALTIGGLLRMIRPVAPIAGRLLTCSNVCGALAVIVGLCIFMVTVVWLHGRDDLGLIGSALLAYFVGAGVGVPVFAVREFLRKETHESAA